MSWMMHHGGGGGGGAEEGRGVTLPALLLPRKDSFIESGEMPRRVKEKRRLREVHQTVTELANSAAQEKMRMRYKRRFSRRKWELLAQLVAFMSKDEFRFQRSLYSVFMKSFIYAASRRNGPPDPPTQRIRREQFIAVITENFFHTSVGVDPELSRSQSLSMHRPSPERYRPDVSAALSDVDAFGERIALSRILNGIFTAFDVYSCGHGPDDAREGVALNPSPYVDPREVLCALRVQSHPGSDVAAAHIMYWFDIYSASYADGIVPWAEWKNAVLTCANNDLEYTLTERLAARVFLSDSDGRNDANNEAIEDIQSPPRVLNPHMSSIRMLEQGPRAQLGMTEEWVRSRLETHMGLRLVAELQRQCWMRNPEPTRVGVLSRRCDVQARVCAELERKIFAPSVENMFKKYKPMQKFNLWRRLISLRMINEMAPLWFERKAKLRGLRSLSRNVRRTREKRRIQELANYAGNRLRLSNFYTAWKKWWIAEAAKQAELWERAATVWRQSIMRGFLGTWRTHAHALHVKRLEDLRAAVQMWQNALARKSIVLWSENVKRIRTERAALEQQQFLMSMMDEATREREVRDMTEAEEYMRRFYAEEAAFIEAETLKRNWEEQRKRTEMELYEKKQERERLAWKEEKVQEKLAHDSESWNVLAERAVARSKVESMAWLDSPAGQVYMKDELKRMREETEEELEYKLSGGTSGKDTANVPGCEWQVLADKQEGSVTRGKLFWYHEESGMRLYNDELTKKELREIIRTQFVAMRVNETLEKANNLENKHKEHEREVIAARKIQACFRSMKAGRLMRRLAHKEWVKLFDPESCEVYYYCLKLNIAKWTKPTLLGSEDVADPPNWVMKKGAGTYMYYNRMAAKEQPDKPRGFMLCCVCNLFLADVRCLDKRACKGRRYCTS
eukprot:g2824.t1